jgi:glycosyltransferase involved in cell wall biosynthesis
MSQAWVTLLLSQVVDYAAGQLGDGIPVALMESAALGIPLVTTNAGGINELVPDSSFGWIVSDKDPKAAKAALLSLLQDAPLRFQMGQTARQRVQVHFDLRTETQRMRHFVERMHHNCHHARGQ